MATRIATIQDAVTQLGLGLLILLILIPLGLLLVGWAAMRVWSEMRRAQLVVVDVADATGDENLRTALDGLSQRFREDLFAQATYYQRRARVNRAAHVGGEVTDSPPPREIQDADLSGLITAIKDSAPDQAKLILALLALIPRRGQRVVSTLQRVGHPPHSLGLSVEISDLADPAWTQLASLWGNPPPHRVPPGPLPPSSNPEATALANLALVLERDGRWSDARDKFVAALDKDPTYVGASDGIARLLAEPDLRERGERFLHIAARWVALLLIRASWLRDAKEPP